VALLVAVVVVVAGFGGGVVDPVTGLVPVAVFAVPAEDVEVEDTLAAEDPVAFAAVAFGGDVAGAAAGLVVGAAAAVAGFGAGGVAGAIMAASLATGAFDGAAAASIGGFG
jgi:hypothetical protein